MTDITPKFSAGDQVKLVGNNSGSSYTGQIGRVDNPTWDSYQGSRYGYIVRVEFDGKYTSVYESDLALANPEDRTVRVTVKDMKTWLDALREAQEASDDPFDNTLEDAVQSLDKLLNPPVKRTYTVTLSGKVDDIEAALANVEANEEVLTDKVTVSIQMGSEVPLGNKT